MCRLLPILLCALATVTPAGAQEPLATEEPIRIGTTHRLEYSAGDVRQVNIYLPDDYGRRQGSYPVLYLIDGGLAQDFLHISGTSALNALWGRSQSVIVVGVETRDRRAELIGSAGNAEEQKAFPTAGHSAAFRTFLREKVKPLIESRYRVTGEDAVMGESLAGLFIVETWLREPALFDRYAAVNPSLWWNDIALAKKAAELTGDDRERGPLYLSTSNEGPETEAGAALVAKAGGDAVCYAPNAALTHATAYHILSPQVLQFLFPTDHEFTPEWGFEVICSPKS